MARAARIRNTLEGREKRSGLAALMTPKMIMSLVLIGIFSFAALVTLSGYADDLRKQNDGQAHALSRSAIGYGGLVKLLGEMNYDVRMARTENVKRDDQDVLRVFTLSRPYQADGLDDLDLTSPTLIVMPKWITMPVKGSAGWVRKGWGDKHVFDTDNHERDLKELTGEVTFSSVQSDDKSLSYTVTQITGDENMTPGFEIESLQLMTGENLIDIMRVEDEILLTRIENTDTYILSDPDLLNTMGIASRERARFAVDIIDAVIADADAVPGRIDFDLTFHGFGGKTNVVKVLTQPPFLAATLCLLAAGALIAWQAFSRFGDPLRVQRDYALGKFSLVDNASRFIRIAGREPNMAQDYAALIRTQVIKALNLTGRRPADIDTILERRETALDLGVKYIGLKTRAQSVQDKAALTELSRDLNNWKTQMILGETS